MLPTLSTDIGLGLFRGSEWEETIFGLLVVLLCAAMGFLIWLGFRPRGAQTDKTSDPHPERLPPLARESPHFRLVRGIEVTDLGGVREGYMAKRADDGHTVVTVSVSAERLPEVIPALTAEVEGIAEFHVEVPCTHEVERTLRRRYDDPWHSDVFRIGDLTHERFMELFGLYGELLIHDGWVNFQYGAPAPANDSVYVGPGKVIWVHADSPEKYFRVLERLGYTEELELHTVLSNVGPGTPAAPKFIEVNGKGIRDMVEELKAEGLQMHDRKEYY